MALSLRSVFQSPRLHPVLTPQAGDGVDVYDANGVHVGVGVVCRALDAVDAMLARADALTGENAGDYFFVVWCDGERYWCDAVHRAQLSVIRRGHYERTPKTPAAMQAWVRRLNAR